MIVVGAAASAAPPPSLAAAAGFVTFTATSRKVDLIADVLEVHETRDVMIFFEPFDFFWTNVSRSQMSKFPKCPSFPMFRK